MLTLNVAKGKHQVGCQRFDGQFGPERWMVLKMTRG